MGIIGDILYLPIRIITFPIRFPYQLLFGSSKEDSKEHGSEKKKEEKAPTALRVYMSGNPDDMIKVCASVDLHKANEAVKAICSQQKGGRKTKRRRVKKNRTK
jgi:hypothetical protein